MSAPFRVVATRAMPGGREENVSSAETLGDAYGQTYPTREDAQEVAFALDATRDDFDIPADVRYSVEPVS